MDPAPFNPNPTLGAVQIGVLISYVLFGVASTQLYIYFSRFPEDPRGVKALTAFVWYIVASYASGSPHFANLLQGLRLSTHRLSRGCALHVHHHGLLSPRAPWWPASEVSLCTNTLLCAHRSMRTIVLRVSYLCVHQEHAHSQPFWCMAFLPLLGGFVLFAITLHAPSVQYYVEHWEWLVTANWALSVATDVVITTKLVIVLYSQRSRANTKTAALVDKLIVWTIQTGMLTSISSILTLACFVTMKQNYVWLTFYAIGTGLFPNSLLASLNSRESLRAMKHLGPQVVTAPSGYNSSSGVHVMTVSHVTYDSEVDQSHKFSANV
ncbi:hypothetical protein B0H12DRAFT_428513 [Mycena haematopus]|nr:hypothetical protein B0H12DRAFT_428513 [Mycena haematopus]